MEFVTLLFGLSELLNLFIKFWLFFFHVIAELGDYNQSDNLSGYLSDCSFIPNQPQDFEKEIAKLHQQHT